MTLGESLRKYRNEMGLSMRDLEEKSGVGLQTICKIENDQISTVPRPSTLRKLASALNIPVKKLAQHIDWEKLE